MHFQLLLTILAALPQCLATGDTSSLAYCSTDNTGSSFDSGELTLNEVPSQHGDGKWKMENGEKTRVTNHGLL